VTDAAQRYLAHLHKRYGRSLYLPGTQDAEEPTLGTAADTQMQNGVGRNETDHEPEALPRREPPTPERTDRTKQHETTDPGLGWPPGQRPTSWADPSSLPSLGCWCSCCHGQRWWCEREDPKGWRCGRCHPPVHLPDSNVRWIETNRR
jgi:hypothetical protein